MEQCNYDVITSCKILCHGYGTIGGVMQMGTNNRQENRRGAKGSFVSLPHSYRYLLL
jgi:hypothetical protein